MPYRKLPQPKPLIVDCEVCGADLYPSKRGRVKHYCSEKCRKEAQRRRERGDKHLQEDTTERYLQQRYATFPAQVVEKLQEIKATYGVYAAWKASEALMLLIATQNVTSDTSQKDYDTGAFPFKSWLRNRLYTKSRTGEEERLITSILADRRFPAQGSKALYLAHLRAKKHEVEDRATFERLWSEMYNQDTSE